MKFELNEMTIHDEKTLAGVYQYLGKLAQFSRFDSHMVLRVFVDDEKDFCAFEAISYRIQYTNNAKKLGSMITSPYDPLITSFDEFRKAVSDMLMS